MEDDDAKMNMRFGDGFITTTIEEARELIEQEKKTQVELQKEKKIKMENMSKELGELKKKLYGKFGGKINLEEN